NQARDRNLEFENLEARKPGPSACEAPLGVSQQPDQRAGLAGPESSRGDQGLDRYLECVDLRLGSRRIGSGSPEDRVRVAGRDVAVTRQQPGVVDRPGRAL